MFSFLVENKASRPAFLSQLPQEMALITILSRILGLFAPFQMSGALIYPQIKEKSLIFSLSMKATTKVSSLHLFTRKSLQMCVVGLEKVLIVPEGR